MRKLLGLNKKQEEPFPRGTYFTGKDRSCFPRSLYEYICFNEETGKHKIRHLFLSGFRSGPEYHVHEVIPGETFPVFAEEYRAATVEEINTYFETFGCEKPAFYKDSFYGKWADETGSWKKGPIK